MIAIQILKKWASYNRHIENAESWETDEEILKNAELFKDNNNKFNYISRMCENKAYLLAWKLEVENLERKFYNRPKEEQEHAVEQLIDLRGLPLVVILEDRNVSRK